MDLLGRTMEIRAFDYAFTPYGHLKLFLNTCRADVTWTVTRNDCHCFVKTIYNEAQSSYLMDSFSKPLTSSWCVKTIIKPAPTVP